MFIIIASVGYFVAAIVAILDKRLVSNERIAPTAYAFYSTIFLVFLFPLVPFFSSGLSSHDLWIAVCAGALFGGGILALYKAVAHGEASHMVPFQGAFLLITLAVISYAFLGERFSFAQIMGFFFLSAASLLLSNEKTKRHSGWHVGFFFAFLSAGFWALSYALMKYEYARYAFLSVFVPTQAGVGLIGLAALASPSVWKTFRFRRARVKRPVVLFFANKALSAANVACISYAISLGSATIVAGLSGLQYLFMTIMIFLLTRFRPSLFQEYTTKREFRDEAIASFLIVIGAAFLVIR